MSRNQRWLGYLVASSLFVPPSAQAYDRTIQPMRILSIAQEVGSNRAVLRLDREERAAYPRMSYLPGPSGAALAIDFPSTSLSCPPVTFRFPHASVPFVSIVQWQAYPPVVRMLFQGQDVKAFKSVAIESTRGRLIIRVPACNQQPPPSDRQAPFSQSQQPTLDRQEAVTDPARAAAAVAPASASATTMLQLRGPIEQNVADDAKHSIAPATQPNTSAKDQQPERLQTSQPAQLTRKGVRSALKNIFGTPRSHEPLEEKKQATPTESSTAAPTEEQPVNSAPLSDAPQPAPKKELLRNRLEQSVVLLDAGHGGSDPGARRGDIEEKELTLKIVEKLKHLLESKEIKVKLTRSDDSFVSLEDRVKLTNAVKPDVFLSVHINSLETNNQATGVETYYQTDLSRSLAQLIHTYLVKELSTPDRNVRRARFYVINHTPYPAVLAEVGFISNKEEREKLACDEYQNQVAKALCDAVLAYLGERSQTFGTISSSRPSNQPSEKQSLAQSFTQNLQSQRPWLPAAEARKP